MPSAACCADIRRITRSWVAPLGARRIAYLQEKEITIADLARLGGAPVAEARAALARVAADAAQERPPITPAVRQRLIETMTPAIAWWKEGLSAAVIADRLGMETMSFNAAVSRYRTHVNVADFPKRLGTSRQHKPRLHGTTGTDSDLHALRIKIRRLARDGTPVSHIAKQTGIGAPRIKRWVRGTDDPQPDLAWMGSHRQDLKLARELWAIGGNHLEIARHYKVTPARMHLTIVQSQKRSGGEWFPPRTAVRTKPRRATKPKVG